MFTSYFSGEYDDPTKHLRNIHRQYPALTYFQECIRESSSGRQALNTYLGRHSVGAGTRASPVIGPPPIENVNHAGLSPSSWEGKSIVPMISSGVMVDMLLALFDVLFEVSSVQIPHHRPQFFIARQSTTRKLSALEYKNSARFWSELNHRLTYKVH